MYRHKVLLHLVLFLIPTLVSGQLVQKEKSPVLVTGVVIDGATEKEIANVQYFTRQGNGGVTDFQGLFSLFTKPGDTIEFRMMGYKPAFLAVSESSLSSSFLALVAMVTDTTQIGEVIIFPQPIDLRTVATTPSILDSREYENARRNVNLSVYQGLTSEQQLVDARANYDVIRRNQKINAFEKGGIPSSQMVSVSPFMIVPALYILMNGLPEKPSAPPAKISNKDLDRLRKAWRETIIKNDQLPE
jgi:hypothetical protein